jgi:hypothetical protein
MDNDKLSDRNTARNTMASDCFRLDESITLLPVVHGCGQYARAVEKWLLQRSFDCLAVPLPKSLQSQVMRAVNYLPIPSIVIQRPTHEDDNSSEEISDDSHNKARDDEDSDIEAPAEDDFREDEIDLDDADAEPERDKPDPSFPDLFYHGEVTDEIRREIFDEDDPDFDDDEDPDFEMEYSQDDDAEEYAPSSYVPIDPCQSVIAALRFAQSEHIPTAFIDLEVGVFDSEVSALPDGFALREVSLESFSAAVLTAISRPQIQQTRDRIFAMAKNLRKLKQHHRRIVMVCSIEHWPWIREAYQQQDPQLDDTPQKDILGDDNASQDQDSDDTLTVAEPETYAVHEKTLVFMLSELPYITGVYEEGRIITEGHSASNEQTASGAAVDGIKRLLMSARASYMADLGKRARRITPLLLSQCLKYIRNLTLLDSRMTPDLYTIAIAAKQVLGDQFAIHVVEAASNYPFMEELPWPSLSMSPSWARLPDGELMEMVSRLPGNPTQWRSIELNRRPLTSDAKDWQMRWNPYRQCSWPPEDDLIESFRTRVLDRARASLGADLARSEKFSTSLMDGIDIRETLRHWYDGNLYVKVQPPSVGHLDACIMLFDSVADPRDYPWRTTWFAEHKDESTLAFYATNFGEELLGPGVAVATYGGALFLYPPRSIPDIWTDEELNFADTLEDRLVAAACVHSQSKQVALLSPKPPNPTWRKWAKRHGKSLVHVPLGQFNDGVIQQLRTVHVLNGQEVRSYAAHFIRKV